MQTTETEVEAIFVGPQKTHLKHRRFSGRDIPLGSSRDSHGSFFGIDTARLQETLRGLVGSNLGDSRDVPWISLDGLGLWMGSSKGKMDEG